MQYQISVEKSPNISRKEMKIVTDTSPRSNTLSLPRSTSVSQPQSKTNSLPPKLKVRNTGTRSLSSSSFDSTEERTPASPASPMSPRDMENEIQRMYGRLPKKVGKDIVVPHHAGHSEFCSCKVKGHRY